MSQNHDALKAAFETYLVENDKFTGKGVKAAAARARKALQDISKAVKERRKEITAEKELLLTLDDEDFTTGEMLNFEMQENKNILFSGLSKPDHQIKSIVFKIETDSKKTPADIIIETAEIIIKKFKHIQKIINKLNK